MDPNYSLGLKLRDIGIEVSDGVTLGEFHTTGRGVQALRLLKKGENILREKENLITPSFILKNYRIIRTFLDGVTKIGHFLIRHIFCPIKSILEAFLITV